MYYMDMFVYPSLVVLVSVLWVFFFEVGVMLVLVMLVLMVVLVSVSWVFFL